MHARAKNGNGNGAKLVAEAMEAAEEAGLRYVSDDRPGYTRKSKVDDFEYLDAEGKPIRDEQRLLRIKRLAIPAAWTGVWICPSPNGHVQATGRDGRRRKQYLYHERWREVRDENKYDRIIAFGKALSKIRRRVGHDLKLPGLSREKVLAAVVQLLECTFIRIGNEEYARENKSFGLTTMHDRHVEVKGSKLRFRFRGKSGREHEVDVTDRHVAKIVSKLQDLPGQDLFQYVDEDGEVRDVTVAGRKRIPPRNHRRGLQRERFSDSGRNRAHSNRAKRAGKIRNKKAGEGEHQNRDRRGRKNLGNTPAICRKCYVHPAIFESYLNRQSIDGLRQITEEAMEDVDLRSSEKAVLKFLESRLTKKAA